MRRGGDLLAVPHKILSRWKNYFCHLLDVHWAVGVRQTEMHAAEPFLPESSVSEFEVAIGKPKRYKSPGFDQIAEELIQAGGETLCSEICNLFKLIWNKQELTHQWRESIVVPIHRNSAKTDCSNYQEILPNILFSRLTPYADEDIGDHQCGFRRNRSTTDQIFCILWILEKKWEYNCA
jgi:hypothetical protein